LEQNEKQLAAIEAVKLIENEMIVGLGTGSTAFFMIQELGKKVANGLKITGVPSSKETEKLALHYDIKLISLDKAKKIDLNIDGADEFDPKLQLIKGGGGALLREKIIAHNSKINIIIADSSKEVQRLGKFKLPIETIPFATNVIKNELEQLGLNPSIRITNGKNYITDENNYILDLDILDWQDLEQLEVKLLSIPGIVETGLFLKTTDKIILGKEKSTKIFTKS
tara:strand:+ start:137470 stop:138144 length:675 start_codon:yes stop_codon:yes gene_type:complete